jgi:hypothetical protein
LPSLAEWIRLAFFISRVRACRKKVVGSARIGRSILMLHGSAVTRCAVRTRSA